jgi:large subunit ribosomal protein L1
MSEKDKNKSIKSKPNDANQNKPDLEKTKASSNISVDNNTVPEKNANDNGTKKAGKSSKKGIEQASEKAKKINRQQKKSSIETADEGTDKNRKKQKHNPPRPKIQRHGKKYKNTLNNFNREQAYNLEDAFKLLPKLHFAKFDESVELHVNLNIDMKQSDQAVRNTVILPHGSGKSQIVAVYAPEAKHKEAKDAGADIVGEEKLLGDIEAERINFDILVASPDLMSKLGKAAKILGPKGLMPNPKSGTVTVAIGKAVKELKGGKIEYRADQYGNIHQIIGKVSYKSEQLLENASVLINSIKSARPDGIKGTYLEKITLTTTMGPSIKINLS